MSTRAPAWLEPAAARARLATLPHDAPFIELRVDQVFGPEATARHAAVLMALSVDECQRLCVLLTRRSPHLSAHAGEYSFPGGRRDAADDSLKATALREAREEVALQPEHVRLHGWFASVPTLSRYQMAAFIGEFDAPYPLRAEPGEVEKMVLVPLEALLEEGVYSRRMERYGELSFPIHTYHLDPEQPIWGATATLLHELLRFLGGEPLPTI